MTQDRRPIADILAKTERLLASDRLTEPTRRALSDRYRRRYGPPRALDCGQMRTLATASRRLVPSELAEVVDLAGAFDARLAEGGGEGWRYAGVPKHRELHRRGLDGLDNAARNRFGETFAALDGAGQDALLAEACEGRLDLGPGLDAARWFEELLNALVELHYAHPAVQVAIGYDGMADARGFTAVGLDDIAAEAVSGG